MAIQLNEKQQEAVITKKKYVRIIAGAGSGKTRVLTMRVGYLITELGVDPRKIVAITFTNKAANEMKTRIADQLGNAGLGTHISTIHSLCVRILREDIRNLDYPSNFTVLDQDDQKSILKEGYKEFGIEVKTMSYSDVLGYIADCKYQNIDADQALKLTHGSSKFTDKAKLYRYYLERQASMYALDFDDLLLWTVRLFKKFNKVLEKWQSRFEYILVDEFQDIDNIQYEMIKQLAGSNNDVYVVGDPDQTIYTWRGANVEIIMNFPRDFAGCETIILNENYRSTPMILSGANSVIANNRERVEKDLYSKKENQGAKITHYMAESEEDEANYIAREILKLNRNGNKLSSMAILYRANYLSRSLEKGLRDLSINYIIYGGIRFYERAEIKDMLSYLRMLVSSDDLSFKRIVNVPRRGIGNKSIDSLLEYARSNNLTMYQAIDTAQLPTGTKNNLNRFKEMIEEFKKQVDILSPDKLLEKVFEDSGYRAMLEENKEDEKIANVKELINDITDFTNNYPDSNLDEYLQMVTLYTDHDEVKDGEYVQLMTVHAAKGLEYDTVFVAGLSQGVFPSDRSVAEGKKGLEEERRLAYVAYTRAKNKLYLTEPQGFSYVLSRTRMTSQFIEEISEEYIEHLGNRFTPNYSRSENRSMESLFTYQKPSNNNTNIVDSATEIKKKVKYRPGDLVEHDVFGKGIVTEVEGNIIKVAFSHPNGIKSIMMNHPAIKKVS